MSQGEAEELAPRISLNKLEWTHAGLILGRGPAGSFDAAAVADPCISFDTDLMRWRLFYTRRDENGREVCAQVLSKRPDLIGPGEWLAEERRPLILINPEVLRGQNWSQPCPVFDPLRSSYEPVLIDGKYWLFFYSWSDELEGLRGIYAASSSFMAGPWTILTEPIFSEPNYAHSTYEYRGRTPYAYWFSKKQEIMLFSSAQNISVISWKPAEEPNWYPDKIRAKEINSIALKLPELKHWAFGELHGLQLLVGQEHRWYGLLNIDKPDMPGIGPACSEIGFAYTDEEWPVSGWKFMAEPIERVENIPEEARAWGEGERLGRHSMLVLPGGGLRLFYESGPKGQEQIYLKRARQQTV